MDVDNMPTSKQGRRLQGLGVVVFVLLSVLFTIRSVPGAMLPGVIDDKHASDATGKVIVTHSQSQSLPNYENGGLLIFYHIYKTGGSTVGKMMHELSLANSRTSYFTMIRKTVDWKEHCQKYLNMAETERKLVMLELHVEYPAPDFPSLVEMAPVVDRWRLEAHRRGIDFFAFTLIREPMAHAISFFNFFHVVPVKPTGKEWNPFRPLKATEANFLHAFVGNRQCQMLGSDPEATLTAPADVVWHKPEASGFSKEQYTCQIDKVYRVLFQSLDWVGTTENMHNETLPLLTKLILDNPEIGRKIKPYKVFSTSANKGKGVSLANFSEQSLSRLELETSLDRSLYDEVNRNFTLANLGWDTSFSM